ncbi:MAG: EAL domain-containing protein [Actinomycetota bacterium]|nr:EAL domain-containing protein [Actinomycetota bacterium]
MPSPRELPHHSGPRAVMPQAEIRAALRADQLRLHYHRIVSLEDGTATGAEALLRWEHPQGGLLFPDDFLPAVAHTPVIHEITRWVLRTALNDLRSWPGWTVSVNISARDATRSGLVSDVENALDTSGIEPGRLVLELTEQAMVQNLATAVKVLGGLRALGVGLALDDFGTGYSSLLYLRDLPITELKIDRTFLANAPRGEEDLAIVKSVAQLGRAIGVHVVAEGIETVAQARCARGAACHSAQGYLWGEPAEAAGMDPDAILSVPHAGTRREARQPPRTPTEIRIQELLDQGASLHTIAAALNSEGLRTPKQVRWRAASVALVVSRLPSRTAPGDGGSLTLGGRPEAGT